MNLLGGDKHEVDGGSERSGYAALADRVHEDGDGYFARGRLRWLRMCLDQLGERPAALLDFGCSDGNTSADFFAQLTIHSFVGVEVS